MRLAFEGEKNTQEGEGVKLCESFLRFVLLSAKKKSGQNLMLQIRTQNLNATKINYTQIKDEELKGE